MTAVASEPADTAGVVVAGSAHTASAVAGPSARVVRGEIPGSTVLFHLDDRQLHFLNQTAGAAWEQLADGADLATAAWHLAQRFGGDCAVVERDLTVLCDQLRTRGLVVDDPRAQPGRTPAARIRPSPSVAGWPARGSYRALDARLRIETPDRDLGEVIAGVLDPLRCEDEPDWSIRVEVRPGGRRAVTTRVAPPPIAADAVAAVERVLGEVNAAAIESVPRQLVLHAAAVADDRGAVLLAAGSNHGKSTLAAALVRAGWSYLTDEAAAVTHRGSCRPYAKALVLDPGSFSVHPDLAPPSRIGLGSRLGTAVDRRAWHVDPRRIGAVGGETEVAAILLTRWQRGSETIMTDCSPDEAMRALVGQAFDFATGGQPVFDILCDLVTRVPVRRLVYSDLAEAVQAVRGAAAVRSHHP